MFIPRLSFHVHADLLEVRGPYNKEAKDQTNKAVETEDFEREQRA